jgi:vancomycin permeability regulator SanA
MIGALFRLLSRLLTFLVLVVGLTMVYVVYDGITDTGSAADCAVVLGAGVRSDGLPNAVSRTRLDTALKLYEANKVRAIIVSGGDPVKGEGYSESESMARYLVSHEVSPKAVVQDHNGTNTDATARDLVAIMKEHHFHTVMIVTSYYHMTRTKMALKHEKISDFFQAHAGTVRKEDFFSVAREVLDIYYHLFNYYLGPVTATAGNQLKSEAQKLSSKLDSEHNRVGQEDEKRAR